MLNFIGQCLGYINYPKRYNQAQSFCEDLGGQLVKIQSEEDNEKMKQIAGNMLTTGF